MSTTRAVINIRWARWRQCSSPPKEWRNGCLSRWSSTSNWAAGSAASGKRRNVAPTKSGTICTADATPSSAGPFTRTWPAGAAWRPKGQGDWRRLIRRGWRLRVRGWRWMTESSTAWPTARSWSMRRVKGSTSVSTKWCRAATPCRSALMIRSRVISATIRYRFICRMCVWVFLLFVWFCTSSSTRRCPSCGIFRARICCRCRAPSYWLRCFSWPASAELPSEDCVPFSAPSPTGPIWQHSSGWTSWATTSAALSQHRYIVSPHLLIIENRMLMAAPTRHIWKCGITIFMACCC